MHSTTVYNTTCAHAYKSRLRRAQGAIGRSVLSIPLSPASRPPAVCPARAGWEAGPAPFLRLSAPSGPRRRSHSSRRPWRPRPAAAFVDRTVLCAAKAAGCRVFGCDLAAGDHWRRLRHLGAAGVAVSRCGAPVEGAVGSALSSAREKVEKSEAAGQGWAGRRAQGGRALKQATEGIGEAAHRCR